MTEAIKINTEPLDALGREIGQDLSEDQTRQALEVVNAYIEGLATALRLRAAGRR